jgi:hypothetical protein
MAQLTPGDQNSKEQQIVGCAIEICDADKGRSRAGSPAFSPIVHAAQLAFQASQVVGGPSGTGEIA